MSDNKLYYDVRAVNCCAWCVSAYFDTKGDMHCSRRVSTEGPGYICRLYRKDAVLINGLSLQADLMRTDLPTSTKDDPKE